MATKGEAQIIDEKDDDAGNTRTVDEQGREVREERPPPRRDAGERLDAPGDAPEDEREASETPEEDGEEEQEERAAADRGTTQSVNAAKRARRREAMERDRNTIGLLKDELQNANERLANLEKRGIRNDFEKLDAGIARARQAVAAARLRISEATKSGDGDGVAEASEALADAKMALNHFATIKERNAEAVRQARDSGGRGMRPDPQHQQLARQAIDYGENWKRRNPWFDQPGNERDTAIVDGLDTMIMEKERLDPATPEYWDRLDELVREAIPTRGGKREGNGNGDARGGQRARPPSRRADASDDGGEGAGAFKPSKAQIAAAQEAGIWDTPAGRKRAYAYFKKAAEAEENRK